MKRSPEYVRGAQAAADVADQYNTSSIHPYRLGDCILGKLNLTTRKKPRPNRGRDFKIRPPQLAWRELHRNMWTTDIVPGASLVVRRSARWKSLNLNRPWRIEVLGSHFVAGAEDGYADLDEAIVAAEACAVRIIAAAARALGILPYGYHPRASS